MEGGCTRRGLSRTVRLKSLEVTQPSCRDPEAPCIRPQAGKRGRIGIDGAASAYLSRKRGCAWERGSWGKSQSSGGGRRCSAPCALRVRSAVVSTASRNQNFSSHGRRLVQRRGAWVVSLLSGFLRLSETYGLQLEVFDTCVCQLTSPTACLAYGLRMVPLQICDMSDKLA